MKRSRLVPLALLLLVVVACATAIHPGAVNQTDSQLYDSLLTAQASLEEVKVQYATLTPAQQASTKPLINKAITAFNTAEDAYIVYHRQASTGGFPDAATLTADIQALIADVAAIKMQFASGATKP